MVDEDQFEGDKVDNGLPAKVEERCLQKPDSGWGQRSGETLGCDSGSWGLGGQPSQRQGSEGPGRPPWVATCGPTPMQVGVIHGPCCSG